MKYRWVLIIAILVLSGCAAGGANPDDIRLENDAEDAKHVRLLIETESGAVVFQEERELVASEDITVVDVLTPLEEYTIRVFVNGTEFQRGYTHHEDTGIWIDITDNGADIQTIQYD